MGMDVDQPRRHQPALGADRAARVRGRQRRRDRADLASGDADVHQAAQPAGWIEHVAASKQKVVFHRPPSVPFGCSSSAIGALLATPTPPLPPSTWRTPKKAVKAGGTINAPPTPNSPDTMPPTIPSGTDQPQGSGSRSGWREGPRRVRSAMIAARMIRNAANE